MSNPTVREPSLPELSALENVIELGGSHLDVRLLRQVSGLGASCYPIYSIALGNPSPDTPSVGFFGGVHGLERIGAQVVISYLQSLVMRLRWDTSLHRQLESVRLVFMPIVNPAGMALGTRANPRGVDLMRNAPIDATEKVPFLAGGQCLSPGLPWYRGRAGEPLEQESQALCEVVTSELLTQKFSIALDCHSGLGFKDRIWFPYAHTRKPIAHLAEMHALKEIYLQAYSHHEYVFEPQSVQYLAHGDLWDHLYLQACQNTQSIFLSLTLEMGSWSWIKKNPRQAFSSHGIFNPLIAHREHRVLQRNIGLLDCLGRAACGYALWTPAPAERAQHHEPPRVLRRLKSLRGLSHEQVNEVLT